ncbi:endolytic transglycosylase MltG [Mumia zhuanghuii]|uniref:Endolytic murein transglycosylase n=2 Tax=Mumia TaxID=1546255 RepID=A0ABW1QKR6_9ACTN|nr:MULTISPECIES: endolytic transglycosylase MltG [Mumia]KAA1423271.1 endolytic transglycosylase MltG [Mumia zhuanghuii]
MSDLGLMPERERRPSGHRAARREKKRRGGPGCFFILLIIAAVCVAGYLGLSKVVGLANDFFGGPEDYPGPGTGSVVVEVSKGDTVAGIGRELKAQDVVASVDAFLSAAAGAPEINQVQPGFYELKTQMAADDAVAALINPESRVDSTVGVPEGARVDQVVASMVKNTEFTKKQVNAALASPELGLPPAAEGNPEGYLYPATYTVGPDTTPLSLFQEMVSKSVALDKELDLDGHAKALGISGHDARVVASIVQAEAGTADYDKVARVIYNRLDAGMPLQMDSTIHYVSGKDGSIWTSAEAREVDSPYNTYLYTGLPPSPIGNPGEKALNAALNPADGEWLYFTLVDAETGETKFADTYSEHQQNVEELRQNCRDQGGC